MDQGNPVIGIPRYEELINYLERLLKEAQAERQLIVMGMIELFNRFDHPDHMSVMRTLTPTKQEIRELVAEWDESEAIKEAHKRGDHGYRDH